MENDDAIIMREDNYERMNKIYSISASNAIDFPDECTLCGLNLVSGLIRLK